MLRQPGAVMLWNKGFLRDKDLNLEELLETKVKGQIQEASFR